MSSQVIKISGSEIRRKLRALGLPGGYEKHCCNGRVIYSKDYASQLKSLQMHGKFKILENGAVMDEVEL